MNYEWIGVTASIFVLLSFLMQGETKIRLINIIGATLFVIYGLFIHSLSVWVLNAILVLVHIRRLYLFRRAKNERIQGV